ncbi:MAG: endospore germination permease [Tissierellia bacterium]|nr:endospore germination permease [Tissierellia bacterium]
MKRNKISNIQIKALIITSIVGVGVLSLPSDVALILDNDGWIAIVLSGLITIPFIVMIDRIFKMYPNKNFFQIGREVLSPILFDLFLIIISVYVILLLAYTTRTFAEVIKAYLLETTPTEIIIITMLFAVSYIARGKLEDIARMALIIYPIIIGFIIFLLVINLPNMDYTHIYPIFDIKFKAMPKATIAALFSYIGYEFIILALPYVEDNKQTLSYSLRGMFFIIGIYLIIFFITLSQYGIDQLKREIWPSIAVIKEVDLPGYFLENLDGIIMAAWVMVVFGTLGPFLYSSGLILSNLLKTKTHSFFIPYLLPIIYIIGLLPENMVQADEILGNMVNYFAIVSIMAIPAIIFIVGYIKKRRQKV